MEGQRWRDMVPIPAPPNPHVEGSRCVLPLATLSRAQLEVPLLPGTELHTRRVSKELKASGTIAIKGRREPQIK